ncbi:Lrp/AsnC family transcriptional regulator [Sinisalibacter aestuarii]|uniref:Transcriptional regulator n=1 Tax=Sinisalibacter aestuarii TaxID=2949426 RepID=A0ABQ5LV07_9RHOB|nr:Lrp/AsnC family transcriptional regulator [Sinisalibacter aestuarii]GKY88161.1 transcriptional regulator [Sinisalibacter aestuarii]
MDEIDRKICELVQADAKRSTAQLAEAVGLPLSTTADRLKRLQATGAVSGWHAALDPKALGVPLCAFVLVDMEFEGEAQAAQAIAARPEVLELHHISGAHSYLMKLRLADMASMQRFLAEAVKPLPAVTRTETIFALDTLKETAALPVAETADD